MAKFIPIETLQEIADGLRQLKQPLAAEFVEIVLKGFEERPPDARCVDTAEHEATINRINEELNEIYESRNYNLGLVNRYEAKIRELRDTRGDDRCWRDLEELYATLPEGYTSPARDTTVELELCKEFIACSRDPKTTYVSPQRRIEELELQLKEDTLRAGEVINMLKARLNRLNTGPGK